MEKVDIFNGSLDLTCLELKTWRSALCCMVEAHTALANQLTQASDILTMFRAYSAVNVSGLENTNFAAKQMSGMLESMACFHKDVFGGFEGSFEEIFKSTDEEFQILKEKSTALFNIHGKLEKISESAWQKYLKKLRVKRKLEETLYRNMSLKNIRLDERVVLLEGQLQQALSYYNLCYDQEVRGREGFVEECEKLKEEFLTKETEHLELMFSCINNSIHKLLVLFPHGQEDDGTVDFLPERPVISDLAEMTWNVYRQEHVFPEKKNPNCNPADDYDDGEVDSDEELFEDSQPVGTEHAGFSKPREALVEEKTSSYTGSRDKDPAHTEHEGCSKPREALVEEKTSSCTASRDKDPVHTEHEGFSKPREALVEEKTSSYTGSRDKDPAHTEHEGCSKPREALVEEKTSSCTASRDKNPGAHTENVGYIRQHYVGCGNCRVDNKKHVTVYALQNREKTNKKELSIRSTMKIKQTKAANEKGMAYGYKKTRLGFRKYGYYPANMVALECCFLNTLRGL